MAIALNVQAGVINIRTDTPQQSDIFLVDTNVWFWQTYTNASVSHPSAPTKISLYSTYLNSALSNGATLTYSGLVLAELTHIIEKTEYEIYIQSHGFVRPKEYRHNFPGERMKVVSEVQSAWSQVKALAAPVNLTKPRWGGVWGVGCGVWGVGCGVWGVGCRVRNSPNKQWDTTKSFKTIALVGVSSPDQCCVPYTLHPTPYTLLLDGYDLLILEAISRAGAGEVKIITDDMDYAVVPGIQVFTSNNYVIQAATIQNKLVVR